MNQFITIFKAGFDSIPNKIINKDPKFTNVDWDNVFVKTTFRNFSSYKYKSW